MLVRLAVIATLVALSGIAAETVIEPVAPITVIDTAAASTCDGYPAPVGKILDECPHGPTL